MDARRGTYTYLLSAAPLSLLSGPVEAAGGFMILIGMALSAGSIFCLIQLARYGVGYFRPSYAKGQGAIIFWTAAFPFVIFGLLGTLGDMPVNPHGLTILGYIFYFLISEVIAVIMAVYFIKHRWHRRQTPTAP
jgi:hypothetical protein